MTTKRLCGMTTRWLYGQIRPTNFGALRSIYGHDPPWPMDRSPHADLVEAVRDGRDPRSTSYNDYLQQTHGGGASEALTRGSRRVRELLDTGVVAPVDVEHDCVLDGNHRAAVASVLGVELPTVPHAPYQTVEYPDTVVAGRRFGERTIPVDLHGKTVLDLGCAQGMCSIAAIRAGASSVTAVEAEARSTTWAVRDAWGLRDQIRIFVRSINDLPRLDADVVLAFSIRQHVSAAAFERQISGRLCVLETHYEAEPMPATHNWRLLQRVPYSRADPQRRREIFLGTPI